MAGDGVCAWVSLGSSGGGGDVRTAYAAVPRRLAKVDMCTQVNAATVYVAMISLPGAMVRGAAARATVAYVSLG